MQAITPELAAILKSHFQAGASGFRGRLEVAIQEGEQLTCSTAIPGMTSTLSANQGVVGPGSSLPVVASAPGDGNYVLIAGVFLANGGTDIGTDSSVINVAPPWTRLGSLDSTGYDHMMQVTAYVSNTVLDDIELVNDGTGGWSTTDAYTLGVILRTDATAPVQAATAADAPVVMPAPMTPGNVLVALAYRLATGIATPTGWTQISPEGGIELWARCVRPDEAGSTAACTAVADTSVTVSEWDASLLIVSGVEEIWVPHRVKQISIDKSLRMDADQASIELANEDLPLGWGPSSVFRTNQRARIYQWFGDVTNEVRTFTGLIDTIHDRRDVLGTSLTCRDMFALLIDQTFSASAPQTAGEAGAVRTAANGVYLSMEVSDIVSDILDRAGWPTADRAITETSYVLDEFVVRDGASAAETIIGDEQLTGLVGYSAWADELGVFHFAPTLISQNLTDPADPVYTFRTGEDIVALDDETDQSVLRTRIKVRGPLTTTTLQDTWRELWRTSKFHRPVGLWHDPADAANLRVLDRGTKRLYKLRQSDRAVLSSVYLGAVIGSPLGISGDPADATIYWVLNAPWIYTGSTSGNSVKKVRKSDNHVLATYSIPNGRWSALKVSASFLWLTNLDTDRFYKRDKADGSAIANYSHTVSSVVEANPSGIMVDGTTLYLFWANGGTTARFLVCDESAPGTITKIVKTAGTALHGGEMDTTTHTQCYGDSDSLGLVAKFTLLAAVDQTAEVSTEVVDTALEDELGELAHLMPREHDTHPGDPDHAFEVRRMTLDLSVITSLAQATETAQRQLDIVSQRRRVLDVGIVGNPAIQKTDYVAVIDPISGVSTGFAVDTYRTEMSDGTYVGTLALIPVEDVTDVPDDDGDAS